MLDLIATFFILASGIVANKYLLLSMSPDLLVGIRMTVSGMIIVLYTKYSAPHINWRYIRPDVGVLAFITFCTTLIPALLKAYALTVMPASKQTLLGSVDPFITALYAYLIFGERMSWRKIAAMCIGCAGIAVAVSTSVPIEQSWGQWLSISLPELAVFLAVALGRYGWMLLQKLLKKDRYLPHELTGISMLLSGACALGLSFMRGSTFVLPASGAWKSITVLWYTTLIGNVVGYTAYGYCLKRHSATTVAMVGVSMPLLVALIGLVFGLDTITWQFCVALLLVSIGVLLFHGIPKKSTQIIE